jgi:signal transduction histidine kinase
MPVEQSDLIKGTEASKQSPSVIELSSILPRLSLKAGLAVFLPVGLLLFLLSRLNNLLIHTLIELSSIILLTAAFLLGWNTRHLVRSQFFVILTVGFFAAGSVDLLLTLTYEGPTVVTTNIATQLWLIARTIGAFAFLCAILSLGHKVHFTAKEWLFGFLFSGVGLLALVWPLGIFPVCIAEGGGTTPFKVYGEYFIVGLLCLAAALIWLRKQYLNRHIVTLLLLAIGLSATSELLLTLYVDSSLFMNFLGHYFKLGSGVLVYFALVEGTLRSPFATLFRDVGHSYEELNQELQRRVTAEKQQEVAHQEASLLYQMSRAMHRTLNLDELAHLALSAATGVEAGGFERATLFTVNNRTGTLQGMLGVSLDMASLVLPAGDGRLAWELLHLDEQSREAQRLAPFNQKVIKQRLPLKENDNALAKAFIKRQVVLVPNPDEGPSGGRQLSEALELGPYACAPLTGRDQIMGVLLVDNPFSRKEICPTRKRFLELFASQAGSALGNASLVKRLEMAHANLQDIQEQLIHGEKMAVLGEMAAQVAHELRNPLVSIGGFARRLSKQELNDPRANEYSAIIAREVRRMEEMLSNILAFSKKQLVCLEECSVENVLQEVFDLEYEHCLRQNIELVSDLQKSLPNILGDYRQLRQVFHNLMINACQVMSDGGVLTIRAWVGSLRGDKAVVVVIEDTGGGISPEIMRNIFNPFFSTLAKGTGLGLSISHRIIAHHHGEIEVINGEQGAHFIITLPVAQPVAVKTDNAARAEEDSLSQKMT